MNGSLNLPTKILKVYKEALTGFSQEYCAGGLNTTSLSQGSVLGPASGRQKGKWNPQSKGKGRAAELLTAWVQFMGQLVVTPI